MNFELKYAALLVTLRIAEVATQSKTKKQQAALEKLQKEAWRIAGELANPTKD